MITKTLTISWQEGEGPNGEPATQESIPVNQRLICVQVADENYPDGYLIYVTDDDLDAANMAVALWAQLGKPV